MKKPKIEPRGATGEFEGEDMNTQEDKEWREWVRANSPALQAIAKKRAERKQAQKKEPSK